MLNRTSNNLINRLCGSISVILCGVLLFGMLFSTFFVSKEFHHDCTGEDCPICEMVAICENFSHQLASGLIFLAAVIIGLFCLYVAACTVISSKSSFSLVAYKVRLNN
ncbi:MAG: hypothetical protein K6F75_11430 [Butyrivibrio sp.]|nr:hypothetical protein [Butyrivibrio sp.]